ncbi:enoyl-CoA hydratase [Burkholderia territorii]|uniref:enoyl-CoA hydratase n=1 Tax=Burkholderia territorii TaxID=1503055 RepID=UPI0018C4528F|nr:enoyl-CoA hydratase [Burkholderia territorii]
MASDHDNPAGQIHVSIENGVGWFVLDNPRKLNAMSMPMWHTLTTALDCLEHDPTLRCIVVTGKGDKAFCVGADISQLESSALRANSVLDYDRIAKDSLRRMQAFSKPSIAMISGYCLGAGLGLAAACDLRIASDGSRFGIPAAKLGIGYYYAGVKRLADLVGPSKAKQMLFTAAQFNGAEMLRAGLIDELVPARDLAEQVESLATGIAGNAPLTIAAAKCAIDTACGTPSERDLETCAALEQACMSSQDYAEGRRAFLEKRVPIFKGC